MSKKEKYFYFISISILSSFYLILYYYSLNFVINSWTFSTAHLDYSTGFVRRGLFGEIMNFFNTYLNFKNEFFFSFYYIFFTSINLILFFTLIKNFTNFKIIFIFLLFNPALFLFQINDPFAFQRGETTIITLMLFHTLIVNLFFKGSLKKKNYIKILFFILMPLLFLNILIYEAQVFLIVFHMFLTINVFYKNFYFFQKKIYFDKNILYILSYSVLLIPIFLILKSNISIEDVKYIFNNISDKTNVNWEPLSLIPVSLFNATLVDAQYMFKSKITVLTYSALLFFSVGLIILIFNYLIKLRFIKVQNYKHVFFSAIPLLILFLVARDWGRWLSLVNYVFLLYFLQFPQNSFFSKKHYYNKVKNKAVNITFTFIVIFYIFFIEVPHCCANRSPFGGIYGNVKLFVDVNFIKNVNLNLKLKKY
tara:strand:- start:32 stop:1297 length:1266 start_codon:yes stop_codon:yes gene_type:complete